MKRSKSCTQIGISNENINNINNNNIINNNNNNKHHNSVDNITGESTKSFNLKHKSSKRRQMRLQQQQQQREIHNTRSLENLNTMDVTSNTSNEIRKSTETNNNTLIATATNEAANVTEITTEVTTETSNENANEIANENASHVTFQHNRTVTTAAVALTAATTVTAAATAAATAVTAAATAITAATTTVTAVTVTATVSNHNTFPRYAGTRKKHVQRQTSVKVSQGDFHDDTDYHADLEEDAAPDHQHEHAKLVAEPAALVEMDAHHKQHHFACNKPQSDSMLISTPSQRRRLVHEESFDSLSTMDQSPRSQRRLRCFGSSLARDNSVSHSDSSRYSSVDSLLEARKPDPEQILLNLGFGPAGSEDVLSRIPKRFLKPSQVRGIDTEAFVKRLQLASYLADHSVWGYRGLTGNPDLPPSSIVAKIMERFGVNQRKKSMGGIE